MPIVTQNGITVISGMLPDKTNVVGFFKIINFSDVEIGKVGIVRPIERLHSELNRLRLLYVAGILGTILLLAAVVFVLDRFSRTRMLKMQKDIAKMERIGPYVLQQKVARGGMAELYLADYVRDDGFRRRVAVKRILPHLAGNQNFIKMFTREARVAALLQHPNVVQIFDYGNIENAYFIAMEFIDGKN
jgi:hypothetical protein